MSFYETLPLLLVLGPPISLLLSVFSLYQFGQVFTALSRAAQGPLKGSVPWQYVKKVLKVVVGPLTATLGDADKFVSKLQPTHVFLWAILIVLIVLLSNIRSELAQARPPRPAARAR